MSNAVLQSLKRFLAVSNLPGPDSIWRNWGGNHQCQPESYFEPASLDELIAIVRRAHTSSKSIRVVGAGHSWSDIVCTDAILVSLVNLDALIGIDAARLTVTVQAGMRVAELVDYLDAAGLALANLGEVDAQHVGGVVATATHGSGCTGSFASAVLAVKLLAADGKVITISSSENAQYLDAVRTNLGCLGIVLEVTLSVRPAFNVLKHQKVFETEHAIANAERFLTLSDPFAMNKAFFFPYGPKHVYAAKCEELSAPSLVDRLRNPALAVVDRLTLIAVMNVAKSLPIALRRHFLEIVINAVNTSTYQVGPSFQLLLFAHDPRFKAVAGHIESEIAIPLERLEAALRDLFAQMERRTFKINGYVLARTVKRETAWLSPAYERDTVYLTFAHFPSAREDWRPTFAEIERFMLREHAGRPHWGKINFTDREYAEQAYPKYAEFAAVRRELDPTGMFANAFIRRHFEVVDNVSTRAEGTALRPAS